MVFFYIQVNEMCARLLFLFGDTEQKQAQHIV